MRNYVAALRGSKLQALEPLTGKPLWIKDGIAAGSDLFGDEELLFAVAPESNLAAVYRGMDGEFVGQRALPPAPQRLETMGRTVVTWQGIEGGQELAVRNLFTEQTIWSRRFAAGSVAALVDASEAAVLEPDGRFTVLSLEDGSLRLQSAIEPVKNPQLPLYVLRSRDRYLLICNEASQAQAPTTIPQHVYVNGNVHGFERSTGRKLWTTRIERQGFDLHQPAELPALVFISHSPEIPQNAAVGFNRIHLQCLDRRTGRIVYSERPTNEPSLSFVELTGDVERQTINLRMPRATVRMTFTDKPWPPSK